MRKLLKILFIIVLIVVVLGVIFYFVGTKDMDKIREYVIPEINMSLIKDGNYTGSCNIGRWSVTVQVTVLNNKITQLEIFEKNDSMFEKTMNIVNKNILNKSNPSFDTITGATITSKCYIIAISEALNSGM